MNILETIISYLPPTKSKTPSGFRPLNCVMCHNLGKTPDKKNKAGIIYNENSFTYHCFRCGFKAHWRPGFLISKNLERFLTTIGVDAKTIGKLKIAALADKTELDSTKKSYQDFSPKFPIVDLPNGAKKISEIDEKNMNKSLINVLKYLESRPSILDDYYWSPEKKHQMHNRFIIPFYYKNNIVGWTARYANNNMPKSIIKYYSKQPPNFIFNSCLFDKDINYIIIVEGPLDAIAIDGIALLGSTVTDNQLEWINSIKKEIVLLPDFDNKGLKLEKPSIIATAIENNWGVSFPVWAKEFKDASSVADKFGKLFTIKSILNSIEKEPAGIKTKAKLHLNE